MLAPFLWLNNRYFVQLLTDLRRPISSQAELRQSHEVAHERASLSVPPLRKSFQNENDAYNIWVIRSLIYGIYERSCTDCYSMRMTRNEHVKRIHTPGYVTPMPYKCSQCEKAFQYPYFLNAHVRQVHTGERPFICDQADCGKGFMVKSALILHLKGTYGIDLGVTKPRLPRSKRDTFQLRVQEDERRDWRINFV